jgi:hypothetical protein
MQAYEQLDETGANRLLRAGQRPVLEDQPVRERELQVARDQHSRQLAALDHTDDLDRRHLLLLERGEQAVLAPRERLRQLLEREQPPVERDELDDVAMDADRRVDERLRRPLLERQPPRQGEEGTLVAARDEPELRDLDRFAYR